MSSSKNPLKKTFFLYLNSSIITSLKNQNITSHYINKPTISENVIVLQNIMHA
ncbi:hypothetical protein PMI10_00862 [Flavobacterium sp. CF136]|nr:hypothetical protein PMI10_00862 [Flavobacterium sp. CF136]